MTREVAAVVGAGLIGRSWALVFGRAGRRAKLFDPLPRASHSALQWTDAALADFVSDENQRKAIRNRITVSPTLYDAVADAIHVQESTTELLELKCAVIAEIDWLAPSDAIIASSTSALLPSAFSLGVPSRSRVLVARPVNPPHVISLVEILGAQWTAAEAIKHAATTMTSIGQSPIRGNPRNRRFRAEPSSGGASQRGNGLGRRRGDLAIGHRQMPDRRTCSALGAHRSFRDNGSERRWRFCRLCA